MKFYLEAVRIESLGRRRTVHILKDETKPDEGSLCKASLKLKNWVLVEELPEYIHLCRGCNRKASKNLG